MDILKHRSLFWYSLLICFANICWAADPAITNAPPAESTRGVAGLKKLSIEDLMDIEVTSVSRQPEKLSETASAIQVVTGEDIRRSGATSIPEALRLADNLQVAQKGSHAWGVSARGFNTELANKLLVMMDGRTIYTPLYSGVFWDRQDYLLADIDRIEVISGPGGTLWGANAVNGVINILTKSAADTQGLYLEAGGGSEYRGFGGVRYGGELATNVYYRVYGKYFDRDSAVLSNGNDAADSWLMGQGGFRVDADMLGENRYTLQGDFYENDEDITTGGTSRSAGGNILGRWSHRFSDDSDLSLQLYYDWTHLRLPTPAFGAFAPAGTFRDDLDTYDLDFQHRFKLGERNRVVWGLGYRFTHDSVENSPGLGFFPTTLEQHLFSGFLQDEIMLTEDLFFTLGSKVEHNDYTGWEIEPSARLQWNVTPKHTLWGAVSRAVRTPSRVDTDLMQPTTNIIILAGGPDFHSETVIAYELGYRAQLSQRIATSFSAFYNDYNDVRSTSLTPVTVIPFVFANFLEGETYGFEFTGNYQVLDWWQLHAGYTLLLEHLRVQPGKTDLSNAMNETSDPQQQVSLRSSMNLFKSVELDAALRWVDTLHNNNANTPGTVPRYLELNVRVGWRPADWLELSVVGQNLLHDHHPEHGFPSVTRAEIERSVYGKITCRF